MALFAGIGVAVAGILVWPNYWHMTPKLLASLMLTNGQQDKAPFPAADAPPLASISRDGGENWNVYRYPGRVAIYRSEKFDVAVIDRFDEDNARLGCRIFPPTLTDRRCHEP